MEEITTSQKVLAAIAHGAGFIAGVGFILAPLLIWLIKKDDRFIAWHAKQALAFQVLFIFVVIVFMALGAMAFDIESGVWIGVVIPSLIWFVLAIVAVFKALTGQLFIYPGLQPFTKKP